MPKGGNGGGNGGGGGGNGNGNGNNNTPVIEFDLLSQPLDQQEGDSGVTSYTYTLTRSGDLSSESSVDYTISGSGIDDADIVSLFGTVIFAVDEAETTITVEVTTDTALEEDETFTVTLSNAVNADLGTETEVSNVILNDDAEIEFDLLLLPSDQPEGTGGSSTYTYTVTRTGDLSAISTVDYQVIHIDTDDSDFVSTTGTVVFGVGVDVETISIEVSGDADVESDEIFSVVLSNPTEAELGLATLVTNTILDDDTATPAPVVEFDLTALPAEELPEGTGVGAVFTYTVKRTGDLSVVSSVDYQVAGVTADDADFVNTQGTVTFGVGVDTETFFVEIDPDNVAEGHEVFSVFLTNPVEANIGSAYILSNVILDDDGAIEFDLTSLPADQAEGTGANSIYSYTVIRTGDLGDAASVDYEVVSISADNSDFVSMVGTVNFAPGVDTGVITVEVVGDNLAEEDEIFAVNLLNPVGGDLGAEDSVFNTILNDDGDPEPVSVMELDLTALPDDQFEGSGANSIYTYTVLRSGDLSSPGSVDWFITGIGIDNSDFVAVEGTANFAAEETSTTFFVEVLGDSTWEADEVFTVNLTNPVNGTLQGFGLLASNTILNDDAPTGPNPDDVYVSGDPGTDDSQEFNIELVFDEGMAEADKAVFIYAADFISSIIQGDIADVDLGGGDVIDDVRIDVTYQSIDGLGGLAGEGSVTSTRAQSDPDEYLPYASAIEIDSDDAFLLSFSGILDDVVLHEMMHAIGFGTFVWDDLGLLQQAGSNYRFNGSNALQQYYADGGSGFLPLDTYVIDGDTTFYWDEGEFGSEIMTLSVGSPNYLGNMTIAALEDMGYDTVWNGTDTQIYTWL